MIVKMALIRLKEKWIMYTERNTQEVRDYLHYFKFTISVIFSFHTLWNMWCIYRYFDSLWIFFCESNIKVFKCILKIICICKKFSCGKV